MTSRFMRAVLIVCGTICVALGVLGIFLPLMPTTVFLLMAAACYARSSERFHRRLVEHPVLGPYIRYNGLTTRQKTYILTALWVSLAVTMIVTAQALWMRALLALVGIGVTLHVVRIPLPKPELNLTDAPGQP